ncbi:hypothetical protein SAMN04489835_1957 [Mycolicibacterium rutilum]|uniref:Uncharacterized protein n=1 Tax=Mycolicibacterium rutilum TaxID=370526 RepID=A0A1H6JEI7_MYCRU|nr:hypothetical protein [Mycolicibacterium rutilum]SEH60690.1 hypothetical protein SAMN04489835_1957 [Mycolicibacterium rutilum]
MRKLATTLAVGALIVGPLATAQVADAASTPPATPGHVQVTPEAPKVKAYDCEGTTGRMGCGPGWFWRDGWRGWACYPC